MDVRVHEIIDITPRIKAFELVAPSGDLPSFTAGAHLDLRLDSGHSRSYSILNDPSERHRYVIAVQREDGGQGGSRWMHDHIRIDDVISVDGPHNSFPLAPEARNTILIAGGIGITPILSMARALQAQNAWFRLIYITRTRSEAGFVSDIESLFGLRSTVHHDEGRAENLFDFTATLARHTSDDRRGARGSQTLARGHCPLRAIQFRHRRRCPTRVDQRRRI
jgi:tetrachlorobenzoquinone reductase